MRFYKAFTDTDTFDKYENELIPGWRLTHRYIPRNEVRLASGEELVEAIRKAGRWELKLIEALCDLAGLFDEWHEAYYNGDTKEVAFKAAKLLGVEIPIFDDDEEDEYEQYAKKVTLKAVNAALPRTTYFNAYRRIGDTGAFPHNIRTLSSVVARLHADGYVDISTYAYGDGQTPDDYYGRGIYADITDIIIDWHWGDYTTRKEAVALIRDRLQAVRDE